MADAPRPMSATTEEFASQIWNSLIVADQRKRMADLILWRSRWRKIQNWTEALSQIIVMIAAVLAFSSGFWDITLLSFISGSVSALGVSLYTFSKYAASESSERNIHLHQLWIEIKGGPNQYEESEMWHLNLGNK